MRPAPSSTIRDPRWLAHRYDPARDAFHFIDVDRPSRCAVPFLTDEYLTPATPHVWARSEAVPAAPASAPLHFVFHAAYCCSTLVAAALDRPNVASTLKEPVVLNDLVGWRHRGGDPGRVAAVLGDSLSLLARPFEPGEAVIVKPSNVVNALAPAMLSLRPSARAVLLYAPLRVYLASIARKGLWGRLWVRDLLVKQLADGLIDLGFQQSDYLKLTDLQVAAVGWLAQIDLFAKMLAAYPHRVRTLNSETLLADPARALRLLAAFYAVPLSPSDAAAIADGPVFERDAKSGEAYTARDRRQEQERGSALYAEEIDKVLTWISAVAATAGVAMEPGGSLIA